MLNITQISSIRHQNHLLIPFFSSLIPAGFPSPAEDFAEMKLDLNEHLVRHPAATFFVRVKGESVTGAGIVNDDILLVDRSLEPYDGALVISAVGGELRVKRLKKRDGHLFFQSEQGELDQMLGEDEGLEVWGVVTYVIHKI